MKTKILLWNVVFVLATAFAAENAKPTQTISLSDGTKITFLGITYGKHHEAPNYEAIGGNLKTAHWINRSNDVAIAWMEFEHDPTNFPNYLLFVSDKADSSGVAIKADNRAINRVRKGVDVEGFELRAYPRWDEQFYLSFYSSSPLTFYGQLLSNEKFVAINPDRKDIGNAVAETLPVTKTNGGLTVTLTNLVGGAPAPPYLRRERIYPVPDHWLAPAPSDPLIHAVRFGFDLKQDGHAATNWQLASVVITDAVSNYVEANLHFQDNENAGKAYPFIKTPADNYKGYVFWPGLLPNEPAWNVRLEFSRVSNFTEDEIVTFTNVPVKRGTQYDLNHETSWDGTSMNFSFIPEVVEANARGMRLKMPPPLIVPYSQPGGEYLQIYLFADPVPESALKLTVIQATDAQGHDLPLMELPNPFFSGLDGRYSLYLSNPPDIKTLNLKLALQRSRYVTFTVKPNRQ